MQTRRNVLRGAAAAVASAPLAARAALTDPAPRPTQLLSRIAFGSCLRRSAEGEVLDTIADRRPDLMLWLGDNIYADTKDPAVMRDKYAALTGNPRFQRLFAACPNLAIWDDHDYGADNVGAEFPMKQESRELFFQTWRVDPRSPRRRHQGVYHAVVAGPRGKEVQIIMLDNRFNRSSPKEPGGTILGEAQWRWLDAQLARRAALRIICSSVQVVNTDDPRPERWADFPHERERLFGLLRKRRAKGVVFLSGDTHYAELSVDRGALGYDAHDLTSSSLDQPSSGKPILRTQRIGEMHRQPNFGTVEVDWASADPVVKLEVHPAAGGAPLISHWLRLGELTPPQV